MAPDVRQIAGYLKTRLLGVHQGRDRSLAVDADGHLQVDILEMPGLELANMSDVGDATPVDGNLLSGDGSRWNSKSPDAAGVVAKAGDQTISGTKTFSNFPLTPLASPSADYQVANKKYVDDRISVTEGLAHVRLERYSATQLELSGLAGTSKKIEVAGEYVDCSTAKVVSTSDNLLSSSGGDAGMGPSADTTYYVYLANSKPSWGAGSLRLSSSAPTAGYLGSAGDARYWRHVGWARTDASTQFPGDAYVASAHNPDLCRLSAIATGFQTNSGTGAYETIQDVSFDVLLPPGWVLEVGATVAAKHSVEGSETYIRISYAGTAYGTIREMFTVANRFQNLAVSWSIHYATALKFGTVGLQFYPYENTLTISLSYTKMHAVRIPGIFNH